MVKGKSNFDSNYEKPKYECPIPKMFLSLSVDKRLKYYVDGIIALKYGTYAHKYYEKEMLVDDIRQLLDNK